MEKYGFVYIWFDCKHKRFYIGAHWGTEDDGYVCSSSWMMKAYRRRVEDFGKRKVLKRIYSNKRDLFEEEYKWLQLIKDEELGIKYYNLSKRCFGNLSGLSYRQKQNHLISQQRRRRKEKENGLRYEYYDSEEYKEKIRKSLKGKAWTIERRKKLAEAIRNSEKCKEIQVMATNAAVTKVKGSFWYNDGVKNYRLNPKEDDVSFLQAGRLSWKAS